MTGYERAEMEGRVLIGEWIQQGWSDQQIADELRMTRWLIAATIKEVRDELVSIGVKVPPPRGSWGHPRR